MAEDQGHAVYMAMTICLGVAYRYSVMVDTVQVMVGNNQRCMLNGFGNAWSINSQRIYPSP